MFSFNKERNIFSKGFKLIGGIDEVGRGPLAGPVLSCCVLLSSNFDINKYPILFNVKDSKKLSPKKRQEIYRFIIKEKIFKFGIGICNSETIDKINILQASFLSMKKAIYDLKERPDFVLVDGHFNLPNFSTPQECVRKGDNKVFVIALASILAKVIRDEIMEKYAKIYPNYGFEKHKGYGTKLHIEQIKKYGVLPIHRRSFKPVRKVIQVYKEYGV